MASNQNLESGLKRRTRFARLTHIRSCVSTQNLSQQHLADHPRESGDAVFWADHQTRGRGRQQRVWDDEAGLDLAVTFSVCLNLSNPVALPAALPVAVLQACEALAAAQLRIKWPNDVYAGDRKLSGVLIDRDSARPDRYRIGVGLNVNRTTFPPELAGHATSLRLLSGQELDRGAALLQLAERVDAMLGAVSGSRDLAPYVSLFRDRLGLLGREVSVTAGATSTGTLTDVDFDRLVLDGEREVPLAVVTRLAPRGDEARPL